MEDYIYVDPPALNETCREGLASTCGGFRRNTAAQIAAHGASAPRHFAGDMVALRENVHHDRQGRADRSLVYRSATVELAPSRLMRVRIPGRVCAGSHRFALGCITGTAVSVTLVFTRYITR
jgi:hypothetical protein